ncbi:hypothetical protein D7M11_03555 [Paenibacillus ginsengarvi]|uniref:Antigen I/II N-terminal domain-containing protein n=2 Tax=Paenibacillus ginsengarvi TaxID=400777 RepID=A0A3B0CTC2_9BACL|nr:hypothetical protein D7M11_03555 [Paenibacillus ginsengarvi]
MKNIFSALLLSLLFMIVMGCQASKNEDKATNAAPAAAESNTGSKEESQKINVDKGLLDVEVTLPASFFNGQDLDQVIEKAKTDGVKEAKKNADGSVTYKMSKAKHAEMMKNFEDAIVKMVDDLKSGKDFKSIKAVDVTKKYSEFTVTVDKNAFENSFDAIGLLGVGMSSMFYQSFNGVASDKMKTTIQLKDQATGTVFKTIVYPDDLNKAKN